MSSENGGGVELGGGGSESWLVAAIFLLLFGAGLAWTAYDNYGDTLYDFNG